MYSKKIKIISITIAMVVITCIIAVFAMGDGGGGRPNEEANPRPESQVEEIDNQALSKVNPEEKNEILQQAGLPYENNRFAITFKFDEGVDQGFRLVVIDKTTPSGISPQVRQEALDYLKVRGVETQQLQIDYKGRNDAR